MNQKSALMEPVKLTPLQLMGIFICFLMNMLDGMDVMVVSYTAPSIAKEWAVSPGVLGVVLSAGLVGMSVGAMFLAPLGDLIGRRTMIMTSALIMGLTVWATIVAQSVEILVLFRFLSGLGIGCMLASTATLTAENAPARSKDFWVSFVLGGYPIGAVLSGLATASIIPVYGWRMVFQMAGIVTLATLPILYFALAESLDFLLKTRPANALARVNAILKRMNQPELAVLPVIPKEEVVRTSLNELFSGGRMMATIRLWISIFMAFATLYFLTLWIPKLASNAGLSLSLAIYSGTVFNLGAFVGIVSQGYLSSRFGLRRTIFAFLIGTAILMVLFGLFKGSFLILILLGLIGFGVQGGFVGMYAIAAGLYPTAVRATGVGLTVSIGRVGGIIGPLIGGVLIGMGFSMTFSFIVFAVPLLVGAVTVLKK